MYSINETLVIISVTINTLTTVLNPIVVLEVVTAEVLHKDVQYNRSVTDTVPNGNIYTLRNISNYLFQ